MHYVVFFFLFVAACCGVMLLRNEIVYRARIRAIEMMRERRDGLDFTEAYEIRESYGDYDSMMYSPFKWTFNQLYPGYREKISGK